MMPRDGRDDRALTEHEGLGKERRKSNEKPTEAAPDVGEFGSLARASEGRIVGVPVELVRGGGVAQGMVRERVCVRALPVVSFLHDRVSVWAGGGGKWGECTWGRTSFCSCFGASAVRFRLGMAGRRRVVSTR